jgi:hypothetical protein
MKRIALLLLCLVIAVPASGAYLKNTASKITFYAWDTVNNIPKTGDAGQIKAFYRIDGGTHTDLADTSATAIDDVNAPGSYEFNASAAELNGSVILFTAKSSTANIYLAPIVIATTEPVNLDVATGSLGDAQIDDDALGASIDEDDFLARIKALLPGGAAGAVDPNSMTDAAWANLIDFVDGTGYAGGTIKLLVDVNLVDGEAPSTSADVTTAVWNSAVASYGGVGTYGQAVEDIVADTAALDSNTKLRTAMTGADTPVAKESTVAAISSDASLLSGTAVVDGTHAATTSSFYVSTAFAASAGALPKGTIIVVTDATDGLPYMGIVKSYSVARKVTLVTPLVITPANGDVVKIYPSIFKPSGLR